MIKRLAHVAIATHSIAVMSEFYKTMGLEIDVLEVIKDQKVKVAVMRVGDTAIELIEATEEDSPITKFLETRGEGIHHISFEVENLKEMLAFLHEKNIKLIDEKPRPGAEGRQIAFIHPDSTGGVLVELTQAGSDSSV